MIKYASSEFLDKLDSITKKIELEQQGEETQSDSKEKSKERPKVRKINLRMQISELQT